MTDQEITAAQKPWWEGTRVPTNTFRWKVLEWHNPRRAGCIGGMVLQQLVCHPGGTKRRWVDVPWVWHGASDDE